MSDSATPWAVTLQALLSMGFSRQEDWSGLPSQPPGDLPNPGIEHESPVTPVLQVDPFEPQRKSVGANINISNYYCMKFGFIMSDAGKYQRTLDKEITIHNLHFSQCALTAILGGHCQEQR